MKRRRSAAPDSLELLLDTLCNTFGGVLFISMLVVVLLQLSGPPSSASDSPPTSAEDIEERRAALESLRSQIDTLRETIGEQPESIDADLAAAIRTRREAYEAASRRHAELRQQRDQALLDLGQREATIRRNNNAVANLAQSLQQAQAQLEEAQAERSKLRQSQTRKIQAPSVRDTQKRSIAVEVRYGRFYLFHEYDANNNRVGPNLQDYVVLEQTNRQIEVQPQPFAGLPIASGEAFRNALASRLSRFPRETYFLDMLVRDDSFDVFANLRTTLTDLGYEVSILPIPSDAAITDRGGSSRGVQ